MFVAATDKKQSKNWHSFGFTLLSRILAIAFLIGGGVVSFIEFTDSQLEVHRWHQSELFALAVILLGGTMLAQLWRPQEKPLLAQFFVIAATILALGIAPFKIEASGILIIVGLFIALYPNIRSLFSISREGPISIAMLVLTLLMAFFLAPIAWRETQWEIIGIRASDIHAHELHWIGSALMIVLLLVAGLLASTKRAGWKDLAFITGGTYTYLGLVALSEPFQTGSWGGAGGLFTLLAGIWYILIAVLEMQRVSYKEPVSEKATIQSSVTQIISQKLPELTLAHATMPGRQTQQLVEIPRRQTQHLLV